MGGQHERGRRGRHRLIAASCALAAMLLANLALAGSLGAGRFHSLWIKNDTTLAAWGYNAAGQVGDGSYLDRSFPVATGLNKVKAATGGQFHSLALKLDGTVWAWGANDNGQLGDGTIIAHVLPVVIPGLNGVTAISAGDDHSLALKADGTVWAWGANDSGQLGDGTTVGRLAPVRVAGLTGVVAIAAGGQHSLALRGDGTVWAWGWNDSGQLGDGTGTERFTPVQVVGLSNVVAISTLYSHSLALKSDGTVWAWGANDGGQLGDGTTTSRAVAARVTSVANVAQVAAGGNASYALRTDGALFAWGDNAYGQLGDGTTFQRRAAVPVAGIAGAVAVVGSASHATIMKSDGSVWAIGQNVVGQLGDASTVQASAPVLLPGISSPKSFAVGGRHSLAVRANGTVVGWGDNSSGQLGDGTTISRGTPTLVSGLTNVTQVDAGAEHSVALKADGTVWAWGENGSGQLGDGTFSPRATPVQVTALSSVIFVAAGRYHSIAVKSDLSVWAWGWNYYGQIGDGTSTDRNVPTRVNGVGAIDGIAAGGYHNVVLRTDGTVFAWGRNDYGQLGDGTTTPRGAPVQVTGLTQVTYVSAGLLHSLAVRDPGATVWAWGDNSSGQLGTGDYTGATTPVQALRVSGVFGVAGGGFNSFALNDEGVLFAWGGGGRNGDGTDRDVTIPAPLTFIGKVDSLAAGYDYAIAQTATGSLMGWGSNFSQKLGLPFPVQSATAIKVRDPLAPFANSDLVVEFYNASILNINGQQGIGHYFFTASPEEQVGIDNGIAGPGWVRTGRTFRAWRTSASAPPGAVPVYRFYTQSSNSHFYTASFAEYQSLRADNPTNEATSHWKFEEIVFYTIAPVGGDCPTGSFPIYRSYNNRFPQLDRNHRITPSPIDHLRAVYFLGYLEEGIAFCSPETSETTGDLQSWYIYPGSEVSSGDQVKVLFIFSNNGSGQADNGRVYMSLPPEVTDWALVPDGCTAYKVACPSFSDLDTLRSGQIVPNWGAGGFFGALLVGTAPQVATGGKATLRFAALATAGSGASDANRANDRPPTARTLVTNPQSCNFAVSTTELALGTAAQQAQISVLTGASCAWTVQNNIPWLSVASFGGTGNGALVVTPQANTSSVARSGTLVVAGQTINVTQAGIPCTLTASPPSVSLSAAAQGAQVTLTAAAGCSWTTQSSAPWLAVAPASGSGSAVLTMNVAANGAAAARTGAIRVGGLSIPVAQGGTVEVAAAPAAPPAPCASLRLQRDGDQMPAAGLSGDSAVAIFADSVCAWSSQSNVKWLTVTGGAAGSGNGTIRYSVQPNQDPALRIGVISAGGKSFTVTQQGREVSTRDSGSDSGGDTSGGGGGSSGGGGGSSGGSSG